MLRSGVFLLILALGLSGVATAQQSDPEDGAGLNDVVVLPFANYSGRYDALKSVLPVFYEKLDSLGLRVMSHEDLRPILREHRVRVVGQISTEGMKILASETGARFAIVGSIDIFEPEQTLEIMISARLVDLQSEKVLAAISVGKTVQETERVFGLGRANEIEAVIDPVVEDFMTQLEPPLHGAGPPHAAHHKCGLVAVVPLDDYSERRHGAEVLHNLLLSELVAHDWEVVEPGIVRQILLDEQRTARGGVSLEVLSILREQLGVCLVVTGELEIFTQTASGVDVSVPRLGYGLRLIDAQSGRLLASIDRARDGSEGETLFTRGREYSMARLARETLEDVVTWMAEEGDQ